MAREDFFAFEIPSVCDCRQFFDAHGRSCVLGHRTQLVSINAIIRYLVRHDQVVLRINCSLDVVADHSSSTRLHRASIRVG
ncbi:hypothetical protein D3C76_1119170 [compost metagenome]